MTNQINHIEMGIAPAPGRCRARIRDPLWRLLVSRRLERPTVSGFGARARRTAAVAAALPNQLHSTPTR